MKISGPVMLDLLGTTLTGEEKELLQHPNVGGIILFSRNFVDRQQLSALTQSIRKLRADLIIAVDQEGGRVQRFRDGFTALPPLGYFGELYLDSPEPAMLAAEHSAFTMAKEMREVGIDISFAPVLDLNYGVSEVIGNRSFHRDPEIVVQLAAAYIRGMQRAGMPATGKHFPGHGAVAADSHLALPQDERNFETIFHADLIPFIKLSQQLAAIMVAHIIYPAIDNQVAGFSRYWLQEILRKKLNFQGIIFSDDLIMAGAQVGGDITQRAQKALAAGCDMVLICNDSVAAKTVVEQL